MQVMRIVIFIQKGIERNSILLELLIYILINTAQ